MKFKIGDHVRVKPGTELEETGDVVQNWAGEIKEIPTHLNDSAYLVELDAPSLQALPEAYLQDCIDEGDPPTEYYFLEEDLEIASRRDTEAERRAAQEKVFEIIDAAYGDVDTDEISAGLQNIVFKSWLEGFQQSAEFQQLTPKQAADAIDTVQTFKEFADNYIGIDIEDWNEYTVREVCIELLPQKMSADLSFFENLSPILAQFFEFLRGENHQYARLMAREVVKIAPQIVKNAKDPRHWGISKSLVMQALEESVDLSDKEQMDRFILRYNEQLLQNHPSPKPTSTLRPLRANPFKNISRNEVVEVKYPDGSTKAGKFKRLEADLLAGKCELLR